MAEREEHQRIKASGVVMISILGLIMAFSGDLFTDLKVSVKRSQRKKNKILFKEPKRRARRWPHKPHRHILYILIYREHAWRRWLHNLIRPMEDED